MARRGRNRPRFRLTVIKVNSSLGETEKELAQHAIDTGRKTYWPGVAVGILCILLGLLVAFTSHDSESGTYKFSAFNIFSFQGGVGGLVIVVGAVIVMMSRSILFLIFGKPEQKN